MRVVKICIIYLVQIHLALTQGDANAAWNYAPPYFVPYVSESAIQYGQPVLFGPAQDSPNYGLTQYDAYQTNFPLFEPCYQQTAYYESYIPQVENVQYQIPSSGGQYYQQAYGSYIPEQYPQILYGQNQPGQYISAPECAPYLQLNEVPLIVRPENNCGVKYVPPISCNASPYPYMPPIIIINGDDDDDNDNLFGLDGIGGGRFGLSQFLALYLALQGTSSDGNSFTPPSPPPPPPPPPANFGPSGQNCQCCCCQKCDSDSNGNSSNQDSGSNNRGTTTHITIVLPKSWGVTQNPN